MTTVLFGAFSTTALCHLAIADRLTRAVGVAGLVASGVALVSGLALIWSFDSYTETDLVFRTFATSGVLAAYLAHANLLLLLSGRRCRVIRLGLGATLAAIAIRSRVFSANSRSTWLMYEEDVGVKCTRNRGCFASQSQDARVLGASSQPPRQLGECIVAEADHDLAH